MTPKRLFNFFAKAEAFTWTALIAALVYRAVAPMEPIVLTVVGSVHGAVFLGYGVTAALVGVNQRWRVGSIVLGIALAIVPFATVPFEIARKKKGLLDGAWRKSASDNPADSGWFDRLFRWFINRPVLLVLTLLAVVVAIFGFLLWMGPPDTWAEKFK
jgi:integral membrane protein